MAVGDGAVLVAAIGAFFVFLVFSLFIYQAMNTTADQKTNSALTLKIAAAHMQVMAIASNLPFQWPPITQGLFRVMDAASSVSEDVIALECMFADDDTTMMKTNAASNRTRLAAATAAAAAAAADSQDSVVYRTTLLVLIGPLVFLALASVFWIIVHFTVTRRQRQNQKGAEGTGAGDAGGTPQKNGLCEDEEALHIELRKMSSEPRNKTSEVLSVEKNPMYVTSGRPKAISRAGKRKKNASGKKKGSAPGHRRVESLRSGLVRMTWKRTRERIIVSGIVVAVLMHPTLTRRSVQLLTCDAIEGKAYLRRDLEVTCWEGAHLAWALTIGLPFLVVYAFGIPFVSWYLLFKRTHKLSYDTATIQRFGFLYVGYSQWWWEVSRKTIFVWARFIFIATVLFLQCFLDQEFTCCRSLPTFLYFCFPQKQRLWSCSARSAWCSSMLCSGRTVSLSRRWSRFCC